MVDAQRVRRLLELLRVYRQRLERLRDVSEPDYVAEHAFEGRYAVQAAAQVCIDLANHVISSEGWRTPKDFRDAFAVLANNDVLTAELTTRLQDLAGLRNRLVHLYDDIDDTMVWRAFSERLGDLDDFAQAIARLIG